MTSIIAFLISAALIFGGLFGIVVLIEVFFAPEKSNVPPGANQQSINNMFRDIDDIPQDELDDLYKEIDRDLKKTRSELRKRGIM